MGTTGSSEGVKRPGREGDDDVKMAWSCTSTRPIRFHYVVLRALGQTLPFYIYIYLLLLL